MRRRDEIAWLYDADGNPVVIHPAALDAVHQLLRWLDWYESLAQGAPEGVVRNVRGGLERLAQLPVLLPRYRAGRTKAELDAHFAAQRPISALWENFPPEEWARPERAQYTQQQNGRAR